jgi:hypothetical protein
LCPPIFVCLYTTSWFLLSSDHEDCIRWYHRAIYETNYRLPRCALYLGLHRPKPQILMSFLNLLFPLTPHVFLPPMFASHGNF